MKRRAWIVMTVVVALLAVMGLETSVDAGRGADLQVAALLAPEAGAPNVVSYQGQVTVDGSPYSGAGYFKFAVVDALGATNYWANDGTASGEPDAAVTLIVAGGLFNVLLGEGMTALPASAFAGTDRYLRTWFSSDGKEFQQLIPDRRIAAAPYALQAEEAGNAGTLDGYHAGNASGGIPLSNGSLNSNLNTDLLDGYHAGNTGGKVPLSNGTVNSTLNADLLDGQHGAAFATNGHTHATLTAGTGLSGGSYNGGTANTFGVVYGATANTAVQGNQAATITAGTGLTGGASGDALGDGFTAALNVGGGSGIAVAADSVALGSLTADWGQTGAYDVVLGNAASELRIQGSAGGTYYGTFDVGDLTADQTYDFGTGGTVWTSGNDGAESTLDADTLDGAQGSAFQLRVSGACGAGSMISAINADGTVICGGLPVEHADRVGSVTTTAPALNFALVGFSLKATRVGYNTTFHLTMVHELDNSSPAFFRSMALGTWLGNFTLFVDHPGTALDYLRLDADPVSAASVATATERRPGARPLETITLSWGAPDDPVWTPTGGPIPDPEYFPLQERVGTLTLGAPPVTVPVFGHEWSASAGSTSPSFSSLIVTTLLDGSAPQIRTWLVEGRHFPTSQLDLFRPGTTEVMAMYQLADVLITGTEQSASGIAGELAFNKVTLEYARIRETVGTATFCWDVAANRECS